MKTHEHFRSKWGFLKLAGMVIGGVLVAACMGFILGFFVMLLWNWLMPDIFGLTTITFWQAWGLVILTHIFFKSFPHNKDIHHDRLWKTHFREKFFTNKAQEGAEPAAEQS